jgi:hypothetical protein
MLSNCVFSRLYMHVLKLTWEKLIFVNFPQFSVFQFEASGQVDFHSPDDIFWSPDGRSLVVWTVSSYIRMRAATNGQTIRINRPDARDLSTWFRGNARPDGINTPSGRGPRKGYIYPWSLFLLPTPPQSHFLNFSELFLERFWLYLIPLCLFVH